MPIIKKRPHVSELLSIAVEQNHKKLQATEEILQRPAKIWLRDKDDISGANGEGMQKISDDWVSKLPVGLANNIILSSRLCEKSLESKGAGYVRLLLAPFAFFVVAYAVILSSKATHASLSMDITINRRSSRYRLRRRIPPILPSLYSI
jgi:hypothetical protein